MPTTAIGRENRSGVAPERLVSATELDENISVTTDEINDPCHCTASCLVCICREGARHE